MNSIKEVIVTEFEINKSVFINYLIPVSDESLAKDELSKLRKIYPDANHHCHAYIIGLNMEIQRFSDDGEPSKTAGMPMLEVLKKHSLTNVLIVSIRYFGGIKLGAGGLVRAYTKGASSAVKEADLTSLTEYYTVSIEVGFELIGVCEKYIRDHVLLKDTLYTNNVTYITEMNAIVFEEFNTHLTNSTNGRAIIKIKEKIKRFA